MRTIGAKDAMRFDLTAIAICLCAAPTQASADPFCRALDGLEKAARISRQPQSIRIMKKEAMTFACGRDAKIPAQAMFCDAALHKVGVEFTHAFPLYVNDCLKKAGVQVDLSLVDQYTGFRDRKKIVHLSARSARGARLDIQFEPSGDFSNDAIYKDYWGTYRLVIQPS